MYVNGDLIRRKVCMTKIYTQPWRRELLFQWGHKPGPFLPYVPLLLDVWITDIAQVFTVLKLSGSLMSNCNNPIKLGNCLTQHVHVSYYLTTDAYYFPIRHKLIDLCNGYLLCFSQTEFEVCLQFSADKFLVLYIIIFRI